MQNVLIIPLILLGPETSVKMCNLVDYGASALRERIADSNHARVNQYLLTYVESDGNPGVDWAYKT
jgi:hypothetical protein